MNQATEKGNGIDLRPEWGIFIPSVLVIILISIPAVLYPKAAEEVVSAIYQPFAANFGTLYLWITVGLIILCVYFACSRYGDIKFGREAGILPVFMDSHDLLFRGGRGGHVLVDHRAPVGHRAATAIRSAHEHAGL